MKILLLAPHPFYQERGTPIAVNLLLKTLSQRGDEIDLLTYGEGKDVDYPGLTIRRTSRLIRGFRPGFSFRKVVADIELAGVALRMASRKRYDIVHAVEESAFIAMLLKAFYRLPYIYDMDSSLPQQMVERMPYLSPLSRFLRYMERVAVKQSTAIIAVCQALVDTARAYDEDKNICLLHDVVQTGAVQPEGAVESIRYATGAQGLLLLYVGNLAPYQGIGLMLESFSVSRRAPHAPKAILVIIGGLSRDIASYRTKCAQLGISDAVHFLGPRPLKYLSAYLNQADILISPRTKGNNTPMKIYAYLQSGKPILATDIYSHTQVLDPGIAQLAPPQPEPFADALTRLMNDPDLRDALGAAGEKRVLESYSYDAYRIKLCEFYSGLDNGNRPTGKTLPEEQK